LSRQKAYFSFYGHSPHPTAVDISFDRGGAGIMRPIKLLYAMAAKNCIRPLEETDHTNVWLLFGGLFETLIRGDRVERHCQQAGETPAWHHRRKYIQTSRNHFEGFTEFEKSLAG
jgi:hypothetical protein